MKQILLPVLAGALFFSCQKKEEMIEVDVPTRDSIAVETTEGSPKEIQANEGAFKMLGLKYGYADLEPYMDAKTIETHYGKHHLGYCNKLNDAVKGTPMETMSIEQILQGLDLENKALRNNAGGYYNHNLFWDIIGKNKGGNPTGQINDLIVRDFQSFDAFKTAFKKAGTDVFGSGWVWLILKDNGTLAITTTANQDNPLMPNAAEKGLPILGMDVWEHAYYLKYKNNRADYIDNFFKLIDWEQVNYRLSLAK
jgi:superoxide dismutase, Fe-Mn family